MRTSSLALLGLGFFVVGCGASSSSSAPQTTPPADAARAIAEADIIQISNGRLYAMSKSGTVSVVDVSQPAHLALLAQTTLPGTPFEMYLRDASLVTMIDMQNGNAFSEIVSLDIGNVLAPPSTDSTLANPNPQTLPQLAAVAVPGSLADSRIVGDVLYLATYGDSATPRTTLTSFDVTDAANISQIDQRNFESNAPTSYSIAWGSNWTRSIFVNDERIYVGGHADMDPNDYDSGKPEGIIDVVDISDASGHFGKGTRLTVAGAVLSRWQMDERNGVFRVISETGVGRTGNGTAMPEVATFMVVDSNMITPLGKTTLALPMQEGLRTVAFDDDRAYAITYNQTDPLFVIDLSNPARPKQRGQLSMPGFMFYLQPHGDRVIGLGIDRTDSNGSLNVSLFDVSNMDSPKMLARSAFAASSFSEDYEILNGELPEDQDRIQKAFRVFDDGTVVAPFASEQGCADTTSGVEVIQWKGDKLTDIATLPISNHPRRAFENGGEIVAVSDSNVRSFLVAPDKPLQTADVVIGTCDQTSSSYPYAPGGDYYGECAVVAPGANTKDAAFFALAFVGLVIARRRRC